MTRFTPLTAFALILAAPACAQNNAQSNQMPDVEIRTEQLAPGVAVMFGRGGNVGVSYGEDGTVLIDDQFAPLTGRIQAAITDLGAEPVRFLINTHWHGDHSGGNENFGEAGALIMAHDNVRIRMSTQQSGRFENTPISPDVALPVVTYDDGLTLHLNGDTVRVLHMHDGHTDGDSIIMWENANIIHMGDLFFNGGTLPFIDRDSGGNVMGVLAAANRALELSNDTTQIIPGHGPMATRTDLAAYRDMLVDVIGQTNTALNEGRTPEQIQAMGIADRYGTEGGFISPEAFMTAVIASLVDYNEGSAGDDHHDHDEASHENGNDDH